MDIVEIQYSVNRLIAGLSLFRNKISSVSSDGLQRLSDYFADNQLDFERAMRNEVKDKGSDYYVAQLYKGLSSYLEWYVSESEDAGDAGNSLAKEIYDRIVFLWIPPIESLFPNVAKSTERNIIRVDDKDPEGYNKPYERPGEHYRSIRYDIVENPDYPHLTANEIYRRLKELAAPISGEGVKIGMLLNIAIKHRLLLCKPQGKTLSRELGMTCSYPAVANVIDTPDGYFNIDDWGREIEVKLLKE